jgi:anti-sigma factor RsiW
MSLWTWLRSLRPPAITCAELDAFIVDYLDGELSVKETAVFERHLAACPHCWSFLAAYRRTIATGRQAFAAADAAPPPEVPDDLVAAVLAARRDRM